MIVYAMQCDRGQDHAAWVYELPELLDRDFEAIRKLKAKIKTCCT